MELQQGYTKLIPELKAKLEATTGRLSELREGRRPHALRALEGDKKAQKAIADLDGEAAALTAEQATLEVALDEAQRKLIEEKEAEFEAKRQARIKHAKEVIAKLNKTSAEADAKMVELGAVLKRRDELISELKNTRAVYSGAVRKMQRGTSIASALNAAGLSAFAGIEWIKSSARQTLAQNDIVREDLIGVLVADDDDQ